MNVEFGVSTWLYETAPLEEAVEKIGRAGFHLLELWGNTHFHPDRLRDIGIKPLKQLLRHFRIKVYSLHVPFKGFNLADRDTGARRLAVEAVIESIRCAAVFKPDVIIVHPGNDAGTNDLRETREFREHLKESLGRLAKVAAQYSSRLAVENMIHGQPWNPDWVRRKHQFGWNLSQLRSIVKVIPGAGICLDTGHAVLNGTPLQKAVSENRVISFHLHDNDGKDDQHLIPGKGCIDWHKFYSYFFRRKMKQGLIFEINGGDNPDRVLDGLKAATVIHSAMIKKAEGRTA